MGDSSSTFKVEPSSPYYINNSDHPGLVIVPKPLNGDNYAMWHRFMTISLNAKNKLGFVDGTLKKPSSESNPDEHAVWLRCNDMVFSWIVNTLDPEISYSVIYCTTAHEIWEDLRERFSQSNAPRIFQLQPETSYLTQDQLSVATYYTKLKGLWDELASCTYSFTCTCAAHGDCNKLMQFLMGLNESYSAVRCQILLMNPLQSARTGRPNQNRSTNREDRRTDRSDQKRSQTSNHDDRNAGSSKNRPHGTYCDDDGHHIYTCWKLHWYPEGHPHHKPKKNHGDLSSNHVLEGPTKDKMQSVMFGLSDFQIQQMLAIMHDKPMPDKKSQVNVAATNKVPSSFPAPPFPSDVDTIFSSPASTLPESTPTSPHPMPSSLPDTTTEPNEPGPLLLLSSTAERAHSSPATSPQAPTPEPPPLRRSEGSQTCNQISSQNFLSFEYEYGAC
ncbi:hypothetical protein L3X38_012909 [Prunus dulcis]|uniref:Retrotransposon Copia-like N-terminal domain-containing protein n=1 Tax=Prunus dulcis TaxID=3755 RepID=A0AAD4WMY8_PRUDU|nr:hypothetical protein L3X38_012909 [Prunus dulcis]